MSDAKAQARQRAVEYMTRLLQMNPVDQGDEIICARSTALGLANKADAARIEAAAEPRVERRKLIEQLDAIRRDFWTMPIATLRSQLSALNGQGFADLEVAVARLRVVAAHRSEFPKLAGQRYFDGEFFSSFKEVLTKSSRDTAVLKEQVLSSFRNRSRRKSGRRMVQLLKKELPAIYQLEADWMNALYRQKAKAPELFVTRKDRAAADVGSSSGSNRWLIWIIIMIAIRAIAALTQTK